MLQSETLFWTHDVPACLYCNQVKDAVLRWPALLSLSKRGPHAVASWLQGGLGLSAEDVGKMIKKNPAIVSCSIVYNLRPKLRCVAGAVVFLVQEVVFSRKPFQVLLPVQQTV